MGNYTMLSSEIKAIIARKIHRLEVEKRVMSTWELVKEKNFHLNSELLIIDRQEFRDLVLEVLNETLADPNFRNPHR